jgi:Ca2+-transporting ATPase
LCTLLLIGAVYVPGLRSVLGTELLDRSGWLVVAGMSLVPLLVGQIWLLLRRWSSMDPASGAVDSSLR